MSYSIGRGFCHVVFNWSRFLSCHIQKQMFVDAYYDHICWTIRKKCLRHHLLKIKICFLYSASYNGGAELYHYNHSLLDTDLHLSLGIQQWILILFHLLCLFVANYGALFLFWEWFFRMNPVRGFHVFNVNKYSCVPLIWKVQGKGHISSIPGRVR